jgi:hypothetical protein
MGFGQDFLGNGGYFSGVTLLQQEFLYDYLLNPLVVSMAHCFPVKKRGGFGISSAGAYRVIFGVEGHSAANELVLNHMIFPGNCSNEL